jgi:hypothetical protein
MNRMRRLPQHCEASDFKKKASSPITGAIYEGRTTVKLGYQKHWVGSFGALVFSGTSAEVVTNPSILGICMSRIIACGRPAYR